MAKELLQWHPGFYAAFGAEVGEVKLGLRLQNEYPLGTKPIVIDVLAIRTKNDYQLTKNIIHIFRKHNIIEYKNPEESLSVNDYYKVLAYACYYIADTEHILEIEPWEITITFVCNHYPRELVKHLQEMYNIHTENKEEGIYYVKGSIFPIQIIIIHELSPKKNLWLYSLRGNLKEEEIEAILEDYKKHKDEKWYNSAMELIARANWEKMKNGGQKMCDALLELCKELFADEFEKQAQAAAELGKKRGMEIGEKLGIEIGEHNKIISQIKKKLIRGKSEEVIAEELEEDVSVVHELIAEMMQTAN